MGRRADIWHDPRAGRARSTLRASRSHRDGLTNARLACICHTRDAPMIPAPRRPRRPPVNFRRQRPIRESQLDRPRTLPARRKTGSTAKVATRAPSAESASSRTAAPIFHLAQASGRIGRNQPDGTGTCGRAAAPAACINRTAPKRLIDLPLRGCSHRCTTGPVRRPVRPSVPAGLPSSVLGWSRRPATRSRAAPTSKSWVRGGIGCGSRPS